MWEKLEQLTAIVPEIILCQILITKVLMENISKQAMGYSQQSIHPQAEVKRAVFENTNKIKLSGSYFLY